MAKKEWIITPGLRGTVGNLTSLYEHLKGKSGQKYPIMILGDRGVGKSLFVHIYKTLYEKDNLGKKVVRFNAASLSETLADSELFGYVKGAFTGATEKKIGLVVEADLLILEEIGELSHYVQAKLLTFLEDGKYRMVGGTKEETAEKDLQIIATTNKNQEDMRQDFWDRFNKIKVPPLYQRRMDILYYMGCSFPDILKPLRAWEIMTLLAYPWPGNVRELHTACLDMERSHNNRPTSGFYGYATNLSVEKYNTGLNYEVCNDHYDNLEMAGIDVHLLENALNRYGLGLDYENGAKPFEELKECALSKALANWDEQFKTKTLATFELFDKVQHGMWFYCNLFNKVSDSNENLFSSSVNTQPYQRLSPISAIFELSARHDKLIKDIAAYVLKIELPDYIKEKPLFSLDEPMYFLDHDEWFSQLIALVKGESMQVSAHDPVKETSTNPFEQNETDLLRAYYLYQKNKGLKVAEAARATGHKDSSFRSRLKKLDIPAWK